MIKTNWIINSPKRKSCMQIISFQHWIFFINEIIGIHNSFEHRNFPYIIQNNRLSPGSYTTIHYVWVVRRFDMRFLESVSGNGKGVIYQFDDASSGHHEYLPRGRPFFMSPWGKIENKGNISIETVSCAGILHAKLDNRLRIICYDE